MKTKILLLIAFISLLGFKQSFASEVFPTSDAIWVIHMYAGEANQYVYGLSGDTIINEKNYQKLYLLNDTTLTITHEDIYVAGIRQTEDKKVWIQPADKKDGSVFEEYLMYDFGAKVGEKIIIGKRPLWIINNIKLDPTFENIEPKQIGIFDVKVKDIEILHGKTYIYIYNSSYYADEVWLEGVGSLTGLFFFTPLQFPSGAGGPLGTQLICMKEGNTIKYLEERCTSCFHQDFLSSITQNEFNNDMTILYDSSQNTIEIKNNNENISTEFRLMSIDGKTMIKKQICGTFTSIYFSPPSCGIYIYNIVNENANQSGKLIIK